MSIDPEVKKMLDMKFASGDITEQEYKERMATLEKSNQEEKQVNTQSETSSFDSRKLLFIFVAIGILCFLISWYIDIPDDYEWDSREQDRIDRILFFQGIFASAANLILGGVLGFVIGNKVSETHKVSLNKETLNTIGVIAGALLFEIFARIVGYIF